MDASQISLLREAFREFRSSDRAVLEIPVGDDMRTKHKVPYRVLFHGLRRPGYYLRHVIARVAQMIDYSPFKILIYRLIGFRIGKGVYISPDVILDTQFPRFVEIGDYVVLGWGSKIFVHDYDGVVYRIGRVKIGAGSVIGGFSFIRAGVTIRENSLVKLGSRIFVGESQDVVSLDELRAKFESQSRSDLPADTRMRQQ
jgi:hypothetical protein